MFFELKTAKTASIAYRFFSFEYNPVLPREKNYRRYIKAESACTLEVDFVKGKARFPLHMHLLFTCRF